MAVVDSILDISSVVNYVSLLSIAIIMLIAISVISGKLLQKSLCKKSRQEEEEDGEDEEEEEDDDEEEHPDNSNVIRRQHEADDESDICILYENVCHENSYMYREGPTTSMVIYSPTTSKAFCNNSATGRYWKPENYHNSLATWQYILRVIFTLVGVSSVLLFIGYLYNIYFGSCLCQEHVIKHSSIPLGYVTERNLKDTRRNVNSAGAVWQENKDTRVIPPSLGNSLKSGSDKKKKYIESEKYLPPLNRKEDFLRDKASSNNYYKRQNDKYIPYDDKSHFQRREKHRYRSSPKDDQKGQKKFGPSSCFEESVSTMGAIKFDMSVQHRDSIRLRSVKYFQNGKEEIRTIREAYGYMEMEVNYEEEKVINKRKNKCQKEKFIPPFGSNQATIQENYKQQAKPKDDSN